MEAAAYCVENVKSVTVIGRDIVPFRAILGKEIGSRLMALHKEKGVLFKMESGVARFLAGPSGDTVNEVELTDGSILPADVCVIGIGSDPATKFLDGSGVNLDKSGAVIVNKVMGMMFFTYCLLEILCNDIKWVILGPNVTAIIFGDGDEPFSSIFFANVSCITYC